MSDQMTDLLNDVCRKHTERHLSELYGTHVALNREQYQAYCDAMLKVERENEIEAARYLLEANGYTVAKIDAH